MNMNYVYRFPVVKGVQANKIYFIAMIPLKMIAKLFLEDEDYLSPEYRAQRKLNLSRIPIITKYILENRDNYVFSALAASIDGDFNFVSMEHHEDIGILEVSMDARFMINDGQHRKAAICEALKEDASLREETIPVVLFKDNGLKRSQQMFTDLNKHAVKTSNSISELYDSRDPLAIVTKNIVMNVKFLNKYTDKEKDNLGKYSSNLFTLNTFYNSNKRIIRGFKLDKDTEHFLLDYWNHICDNIVPWNELEDKQISKVELRENYIITQSVIIQVLGRLGNYMLINHKKDYKEKLKKLKEVDWKRCDPCWKERIISNTGRIINNEKAIILSCNQLKKMMDLPLDEFEKNKENILIR